MNYSPKIWIPVACVGGIAIGIFLTWAGLVPPMFLPKATSLPPAPSFGVHVPIEYPVIEESSTTTTEIVENVVQQFDETEVQLEAKWLPVMQDMTLEASKILARLNLPPEVFTTSTSDEYQYTTSNFDGLWLMGSVASATRAEYNQAPIYLLSFSEEGLGGTYVSSYVVLLPKDGSVPRIVTLGQDVSLSSWESVLGQMVRMSRARFSDPEPQSELHLANGRVIKNIQGPAWLVGQPYDVEGRFARLKPTGITQEGFVYFQTTSSAGVYVVTNSKKIYTYYGVVLGSPALDSHDSLIPAIQWVDGQVRQVGYETRPTGGCGPGTGPNVVPVSAVMLSKLRSVGTMEGEPVYAPRNPATFPRVMELYDEWYTPDGKAKPSMDVFLQTFEYPLLYWKNGLGQWVEMRVASLMPAAECGKPVIYLYPPKTTPVSVRLPSFINVTVSEPTYPKAGWRVTAHPDGKLETADGRVHDSLFWEGTGVTYDLPREGFILKDGEVDARLQELLVRYGLNQKESQDFRDFWVPRMTGAPYYRVTFLTDVWSKAVPLAVSPRPTTSIRLFMDWQRLHTPIDLPEPIVQTPRRDGFTLVEWGGLLR